MIDKNLAYGNMAYANTEPQHPIPPRGLHSTAHTQPHERDNHDMQSVRNGDAVACMHACMYVPSETYLGP
jgi:hypothetical protein